VGFGLFQLIKRRIEETHLRVCCFPCVCVCDRERERERERGKLYLVKDSLEIIQIWSSTMAELIKLWPPCEAHPSKFQDLFFNGKQNGGVC
jgi:hypothetical protein